MKSEVLRVTHELQAMKDKIKENSEKIKVNKTLPYLVSNVIEVRVLHTVTIGHRRAIRDVGCSQTADASGSRSFRSSWLHDLEVHVTCPFIVCVFRCWLCSPVDSVAVGG